MKNILLVIFCLLIIGCGTVGVAPQIPADPETMQKRFITISQLRTVLSRAEVSGLLGKEVITGYALQDESAGIYTPITVVNPQRSETIRKDNRTYIVDYYLLGIKNADGKISDDEIVPIVFLNDRLAGAGWDFLNQRVKGQ